MQKNCLHETQMRGGRAHGVFKDWSGRVGVRVGHERSSGVVVCRHVSHGEE